MAACSQAPQAHACPCPVVLASGALAGASVEAVLFPLDSLKTRAQAQGVTAGGAARSVYRGVGTGVASAAPGSAIFFGVYEFANRELRGSDPSGCRHLGASVLASVLGELAASSVRVPADFVKQRLQAGVANNFCDGVRALGAARSSVLLASWRATAMRDISHSALQFPLYEGLKLAVAMQTGRTTVDSLPAWQAAVCGSVAGGASAFLTTPFDLLRTRVNLHGDAAANAHELLPAGRRTLFSKEFREIYRQRGVAGFFAGAGYRAACMGLGGFVFMGAFEAAKTLLSGVPSTENASVVPSQELRAVA